MRSVFTTAVVLALVAPGGRADDKPKPPAKAETLGERLAALKREDAVAQQETMKKYQEMTAEEKDGKKVDALFEEAERGQITRYEAALSIVKADPKSEAGFDALEWLLTIPRVYHLPQGKPAMELAAEHHAANPKIGKVVLTLGRYGTHESYTNHKPALALLAAVGERNKDRIVLGQLAVVRAWDAKGQFDRAEYVKAKNQDELAAAAEKLFEAVAEDFGDVKLLGRGGTNTLGDVAKVELFELRNLRVGKPAPEIEGEDLDGTKFKLSDYKGKVVMLDFWGDW